MFKERLILLFFVLLVFLLLAIKFLPKKNHESIEEKNFWINKTHTNRTFDWVFIGDSRIYRGISPAAIKEKYADISAFNLGYSSGSLSENMLKEAEKKLNWKSTYKTMIIGIAPHTLTPNAAKDEHFLQEKNRKKEEILEARYFGIVKQTFIPTTIYDLYGDIFNKDRNKKDPKEVIYYQQYDDYGWVASWKSLDDPEEALPPYRIVFNDNKVSDSIFKGFIKFVKKWVAEGVKVYAFRPPTTEKMVQVEDSLSGYKETNIRNTFEQAGGIWIPVENGKYQSYDGSHIKKQDAIRLSQDIATFIQQKYSTRKY